MMDVGIEWEEGKQALEVRGNTEVVLNFRAELEEGVAVVEVK